MPSVLMVDGAKIFIPKKCADCDEEPTQAAAVDNAKKWNELAETCSFCGRPIALVSGPLLHLHTEREGNIWTIEKPEWEPSFECYRTGSFGSVDVHAHQSCAQSGMPYLPWDGPAVAPKGIPVGVEMPSVTVDSPCDECGVTATQEDIETVVGRMYELSYGSVCAYCGGVIRLEMMEIWHKALYAKHIGRWHFKKWKWELSAEWTVYRPGAIIEARGHLACAVRAMPHARWEGRRPVTQ